MRKLPAALLLAVACTSAPAPRPPTPVGAPAAAGSSCDLPVVIHAAHEDEGIHAENEWILAHYGRFMKNGQALLSCSGKAVDRIDFTTADGRQLKVWFDISEWLGK